MDSETSWRQQWSLMDWYAENKKIVEIIPQENVNWYGCNNSVNLSNWYRESGRGPITQY